MPICLYIYLTMSMSRSLPMSVCQSVYLSIHLCLSVCIRNKYRGVDADLDTFSAQFPLVLLLSTDGGLDGLGFKHTVHLRFFLVCLWLHNTERTIHHQDDQHKHQPLTSVTSTGV